MQHTLLEILKKATDFLGRYGVENPRLDAEVMLARILGLERIHLYVQFDRPLDRDELDRYREAVVRRARGAPVAYITGVREFMSLEFRVAPGVLIPRPETELSVEQAIACLEHFRKRGNDSPTMIDIGTGSGAIACAVAYHAPWSRVLAVDISEQALRIARGNVESLGLENRVTLIKSDLYSSVPADWLGACVIASNPPYIPTADIPKLQREISEHEPSIALDGGSDGLDVYRRLAAGAKRVLSASGFIVLEVGDGQADDVGAILTGAGLSDVEVEKDLAGIGRVVVACAEGGVARD